MCIIQVSITHWHFCTMVLDKSHHMHGCHDISLWQYYENRGIRWAFKESQVSTTQCFNLRSLHPGKSSFQNYNSSLYKKKSMLPAWCIPHSPDVTSVEVLWALWVGDKDYMAECLLPCLTICIWSPEPTWNRKELILAQSSVTSTCALWYRITLHHKKR